MSLEHKFSYIIFKNDPYMSAQKSLTFRSGLFRPVSRWVAPVATSVLKLKMFRIAEKLFNEAEVRIAIFVVICVTTRRLSGATVKRAPPCKVDMVCTGTTGKWWRTVFCFCVRVFVYFSVYVYLGVSQDAVLFVFSPRF